MADDRIVIRCKTCGGWNTLLKHYAGTGPKANGFDTQWLDGHANCHPSLLCVSLEESNFELLVDADSYDPDKQGYTP